MLVATGCAGRVATGSGARVATGSGARAAPGCAALVATLDFGTGGLGCAVGAGAASGRCAPVATGGAFALGAGGRAALPTALPTGRAGATFDPAGVGFKRLAAFIVLSSGSGALPDRRC
ncbi:MAG TPA: hypothetical protein VNW92_18265 [Polyangiaceae bacterium]|nr:hypothetical protein [Polyangiaceae bacterium]